MRKRILSLLLTVLMVIGLMPTAVFAATNDPHQNQVHVIIENTTFHEGMEGWEEKGQFWDDIHVDTWVDLDEDSSMMSCIVDAADEAGSVIEGAENNYISRIDGLGEFDGGPMSGWMGTLNDWFVNEGFCGFTVENGKLSAGDEIRVMYTVNGYGEDLGGFWGDYNTTLKAIEFSEGTLDTEFDADTLNYVLTVPANTEEIKVTPTAANKNFQVFTKVNSVVYKRTQMVPIANGTEIVVSVGEGESMNGSADPTFYTFTVQKEGSQPVDPNPNPNPNPDPNPQVEIPAELSELNATVLANYDTTKTYLSNLTTTNNATVNSIGGEWWIIDLARSETTPANAAFYQNYYATVEQYVSANINADQRLHKSKATDNERVILALTAIGKDPRNVAGHNLLQGLNSMKYLKKQGINGVIWALIAFDSHNYAIPANTNDPSDAVTREKLIDHILSVQTPERGWTLSGKKADPDMTGMAIQALAPYYNERADVKEAVDAALNKMAELVNDRGGLSSYGTENSESVSQIVVALTALGINPLTDTRFIKNGHSIMETYDRFYVEGGGFKHILNGSRDGMATEQAFYALASYSRLLNGKTSLYDMSDVQIS